jgi:hypothetical protein
MTMIRAFVVLLAVTAWPTGLPGQVPDTTAAPASPTLEKGDTVRFILDLGDDVTEYTGHVREVINPRHCLFVRLDSIQVIRGRHFYSFGTPMWPTFRIDRLTGRGESGPSWETIRGRRLLDDGIRCLEANELTDAGYLNPE